MALLGVARSPLGLINARQTQSLEGGLSAVRATFGISFFHGFY